MSHPPKSRAPKSRAPKSHPPKCRTVVEVLYPEDRGAIGLRGSVEPLSWETTLAPTRVEDDHHVFELEVPWGALLELKVVRNDEEWASGRNYTAHAGDHLSVEPTFDACAASLELGKTIASPAGELRFDVLLPPSYGEQTRKRYPVLYVLDGQSLWSTSEDPFGVWSLEKALDGLYELDAVEELVVVGVHTAEDRVDRLTPVAAGPHGGGGAGRLLDAIVGPLREHVDATYRTRRGREHTGILGSSLGGLFAFHAAWERPDVFGKAGCLSSSFWWADRWMVRRVQDADAAPEPRPLLYLDSGASPNQGERDPSARDGFHHTRSMFRALAGVGYEPGVDVHRLVFTGARHEAAAWAARIATPLQLLFPNDPRPLAG